MLTLAIINLDFADVRNTLANSGVSLIGFGMGSGPNRAKDAANNAINSPLLEASITGARRAIVAVTCGPNVSLFDAQDTVNLLIDASGHDIDVKFGITINDQLNDEILVSVIASDFEEEVDFSKPSTFTPVEREVVREEKPQEENILADNEQEEESSAHQKLESANFLPDFLKGK